MPRTLKGDLGRITDGAWVTVVGWLAVLGIFVLALTHGPARVEWYSAPKCPVPFIACDAPATGWSIVTPGSAK